MIRYNTIAKHMMYTPMWCMVVDRCTKAYRTNCNYLRICSFFSMQPKLKKKRKQKCAHNNPNSRILAAKTMKTDSRY